MPFALFCDVMERAGQNSGVARDGTMLTCDHHRPPALRSVMKKPPRYEPELRLQEYTWQTPGSSDRLPDCLVADLSTPESDENADQEHHWRH
jgi:hypothetical protein